MTPEQLQQLIQAGESLDVEFKGEARGPLSDNDLVETVVCLANRSTEAPAWLLVGVEDDGQVSGAQPRHESGRTDPARLAALIASRTRPSLTPRVAVGMTSTRLNLSAFVALSERARGWATLRCWTCPILISPRRLAQ
jgi:ATP-dependent DNA helicase RecG